MEVPYELPVKAFTERYQFEIRDPKNRIVLKAQLMSFDLNYINQLTKVFKNLEYLMNSQVVVAPPAIAESPNTTNGTIENVVQSVIEQVKKRRGRKPKQK